MDSTSAGSFEHSRANRDAPHRPQSKFGTRLVPPAFHHYQWRLVIAGHFPFRFAERY
jgi:hypothetical protein